VFSTAKVPVPKSEQAKQVLAIQVGRKKPVITPSSQGSRCQGEAENKHDAEDEKFVDVTMED
jgi:hypothetical protein